MWLKKIIRHKDFNSWLILACGILALIGGFRLATVGKYSSDELKANTIKCMDKGYLRATQESNGVWYCIEGPANKPVMRLEDDTATNN